MAESSSIAVTVIGGYLGAGKTTLLNHLLAVADERVAILVNDFGALDIDAQLLDRGDGKTVTLPNGCICCSLVDGLAGALDDLAHIEPSIERVVIEASGVADPAGIAAYCHRRPYRLDLVVVLVDTAELGRLVDDEYVGETVRTQLRGADLVVLNKADLGDVSRAAEIVARYAPGVPTVTATGAEIDPRVLIDLEPRRAAQRAPLHDHGVPFETWSWRGGECDETTVREMADALPAAIVRAKGIVATPHGPLVFQRVGSRWSLVPGSAPVSETQIVAIGTPGALSDGWLMLQAAAARPKCRSSATATRYLSCLRVIGKCIGQSYQGREKNRLI